jgi:hypothetical protein
MAVRHGQGTRYGFIVRAPDLSAGSCRRLSQAVLERTFWSSENSNEKIERRNRALAICAWCPVRQACRDDHWGEVLGIWGGTTPEQRTAMRVRLRRRVRRMNAAQRAALAARLYARYTCGQGESPALIARRTGYHRDDVMALLREHEATLHIPEERVRGRLTADEMRRLESAVARGTTMRDMEINFGRSAELLRRVIADLDMTRAGTAPEWPSGAPEGDAWVWHKGMARSAQYAGQSADGRWIFVTLRASASALTKVWISARLVQLRKPVAVNIIERGARAIA